MQVTQECKQPRNIMGLLVQAIRQGRISQSVKDVTFVKNKSRLAAWLIQNTTQLLESKHTLMKINLRQSWPNWSRLAPKAKQMKRAANYGRI